LINYLIDPGMHVPTGLKYCCSVHQMEIVGVRVELPANTPMMLLKETDGDGRLLPILIGNPEAASIHAAMQGIRPPRPLTHDLLCSVIEVLDHRIERVTITEIRDHVFMAELSLVDGDGAQTSMSCRPSDACALAIRTEAPIFASDDVMNAAGQSEPATADEEEEELLDEFQDFLESVNPDDFLA
jgi:bifunctional DNase/RNase